MDRSFQFCNSTFVIRCFSFQAVIRKLLLFTLDDSHRKICTAISVAVASIATYDWPEEWPELLPCLLDLMNNRINMNGGMALYFGYIFSTVTSFFHFFWIYIDLIELFERIRQL